MVDTTFKLTARELTGYTTTASLTLTVTRNSRILNVGPYQLLMIIPPDIFSPQIMFITKPTLTLDFSQPLYLYGATSTALNVAGLILQDDEGYLAIVHKSPLANQNLQTYKFLLDPCTSRDTGNVCQECLPGFYRDSMLAYNRCFASPQFRAAYGIDLSTPSMLKPCAEKYCTSCISDYNICTACDTSSSRVLLGTKCVTSLTVETLNNPYKHEFVDVSLLVLLRANNNSDTDMKQITQDYVKVLQLNITAQDAITKQTVNDSLGLQTQLTYISAGVILLDLKFNNTLGTKDLSLTIQTSDFTEKLLNRTGSLPAQNELTVSNISHVVSFSFPNTKDELGTAEKSATYTFVRHGSEYLSNIRSPVGLSFMSAGLALDPTGTFFRFTKILQIVNKLYFININYGKRLETFLAGPAVTMKPDPVFAPEQVLTYTQSMGRLTRNMQTVDFIEAFGWQATLYLVSWALQLMKRFMLDHCTMGRVGIYFCHYANKVHLIVFNLVFVDFIWLAPRTLLHSRDISLVRTQVIILVVCLVGLDLYAILTHLLDKRIWVKALEHYTKLQQAQELAKLMGQGGGVSDTASYTGSKTTASITQHRDVRKWHSDGGDIFRDDPRQINYKKTYFEIDFNVHLMNMATFPLRIDESVYDSAIVRVLTVILWWKTPFYVLMILSCQYANTFMLIVLLIISVTHLSAIIYAYLKYKYLKNIICLLMEVSQSIFLILFFLIALLISPKRFDEPVIDFYQDAGIWIVICSCVAEYLLLITYITVAAYEFIKNRNMMKKMNVQTPIVYYFNEEEDLIHISQNLSPQGPGNELARINVIEGSSPAANQQSAEVLHKQSPLQRAKPLEVSEPHRKQIKKVITVKDTPVKQPHGHTTVPAQVELSEERI